MGLIWKKNIIFMGFTEQDLKKKGFVKDDNGNFIPANKAPAKKNPEPELKTKKPRKIDKEDSIWIPYQVPSKKNNSQIYYKKCSAKTNGAVKHPKMGYVIPFITSSEKVKEYTKITKMYYFTMASQFKKMTSGWERPIVVRITFVKSSKTRFDFNNANHLVTDLMQSNGWIKDDDMTNILPIPPLPPDEPFFVDKYNPGVIIKPIKL